MTKAVFTLSAALAASTLALSACDKPKPQEAAAPAPAGVPAVPAVPVSTGPLPAQPTWAKAYLGKALTEAFPGPEGSCVGNTDNVTLRYRDGVEIVGWGWDLKKKDVVERIVIVNADQVIVAAGETGEARPDVIQARPEVTSPTTGWKAVAPLTAGGINAFGVTDDGRSTCRLGHLDL